MSMLSDYLARTPKTIFLKGTRTGYNEALCTVAVNPGYLVQEINSSGVMKCRPHPTQGGDTPVFVAWEESFVGKTINDQYAIGQLVRYSELKSGDEAQVRLPAGATAVVIGDLLMSNGDGTFVKVTGSNKALVEATENVDNSAGGAEAFVNVKKI